MKWPELPLYPDHSDIVYSAKETEDKARIWDVAENKLGNPVIVYARFPDNSNHVYCYAIWHNDAWNNYELVNSGGWFPHTPEGTTEPKPNYSGGIALNHEDPSIVDLSREKNGVFEIEQWQIPDYGKNWATTPITGHSRYENVRPFVVRNYNRQDSLRRILWVNVQKYVHYTNYHTSIKINLH